ncbi:hypothetical protein FRP1_28820 (plasmid) [Pseudonocardia sp. EC080625-04]|uniref:hypothetical protein n=1 Tax=Pseudonocardia sp. EC080625-04 TaxID=1096868 RepID=UPI0006CAFF98|nr:hypothetical protein [Pseudonocardia sp. EC080625-04]ALE76800.1 hypothetical protein FRP1_28820 [Pseudonocardia sp. EC080625-04]
MASINEHSPTGGPHQAAATAAAAAMVDFEAVRHTRPLDPGVTAWPHLCWEPVATADLGLMWCFWCDSPMLWQIGEHAWQLVNPGEAFGDPGSTLIYLHAECVPELYHRQRLTRAREAVRHHHAGYRQAMTAAYGSDGGLEPSPAEHSEIDDLARSTADATGELLDLLDAEPRL